MTRVDGIIILDTTGKPLITSHFAHQPPSYAAVHVDAYNHHARSLAHSSASPSGVADGSSLPAILWVDTLTKAATTSAQAGSGGAGLCHVQREGLKFLVPLGQEVNPLFAFAFLESFLETLEQYLGDVTEASIKDNFDVVYMLIEEMLDEGHPVTTETSMLKEIVLPPTLMGKLLSAAGVSGLQNSASAPFSAPIPWRRQNVRHANNEITFDIAESLHAVVDRRGNVLSSSITGTVQCNSRLSGVPDCLLVLGNAKGLEECGFHPCIRYSKWERDHVLSFIPPDGRFQLLDYQTAVPVGQKVPLQLKASMTVDEYGGKFSLTLFSRLSRPIEDISISICLGAGAASVSATATGDKRFVSSSAGGTGGVAALGGIGGMGAKEEAPKGGVGGGTWEFDPHTQVMRWKLASLVQNERPPTLTGSFVSTVQHPIPCPSFDVRFTVQNHTFTGLKVDQLKVTGDVLYKPYKGVRTIAKAGRMEVRW